MTRVSSQKIRQALLSLGDPLDPSILPERLQLFNEAGEPLMIGTELGRHDQVLTTEAIDPSENTFLTWTAFPAIRLFKITTDRPARVRVYPDDTFRAADVARSIGTRPRGNNGRLLEVVTTPDMLELTLTPTVDFISKEDGFSDYYASITNLDSVAGEVVTTFYYIRTE